MFISKPFKAMMALMIVISGVLSGLEVAGENE
jgi:hypothetical protein